MCMFVFFLFKQKTAYEMRISDWSSDVCSSDLEVGEDEEPERLEISGHENPSGHERDHRGGPDGLFNLAQIFNRVQFWNPSQKSFTRAKKPELSGFVSVLDMPSNSRSSSFCFLLSLIGVSTVVWM